MKKGKFLILSLCVVFFLNVTGCKKNTDTPQDLGSTNKSTSADFRNKDASGTVYGGRFAGRAADDDALDFEFIKVTKNVITENGSTSEMKEDEIKKLITFKDSAAGINVVFDTPAEWVTKGIHLDWFQMDYIESASDGSMGGWSTQVKVDDSVRLDENKIVKDEFSFEYPLVLPGKETYFVFQLSGTDYKSPEYKVELCFYMKVTPKHGTARVDNLPENWYERDKYTEFKNGVMILKNIVPPEAQKVNKSILVQCETAKDKFWAEDSIQIKGFDEDVEYGQKTDFFIGDIEVVDYGNNPLDISNHPYCHIDMTYHYKIKNFDDLTFSTPGIETENIDSSFFKIPVKDRKVSKTVINGNKVIFDGDGYFDGLYEGDINVKYNGESFIPAIFVEGLDVYILSVEDDVYTLRDKKSIREYLEEGGSFNNKNASDNKVYTKLKTDTTEANIFKTDIKEIDVKGSSKTITIEDVAETVVLAKNYPWVDGVQDNTQPILNYEASLDVTELYGDELPKAWDVVHIVWNGVSDKDIKKLNVTAVDRSEAAGYWTDLINDKWRGVTKEDIKENIPFTIEYDLVLEKDCIANINIVFSVEKEDVSDEPTITKVTK